MNRKALLVPRVTLLALALLAPIANPARADDQPHMQAALEALKTAARELAAAKPDKGGHRDEAIHRVDEAIRNVEAGIAYADKKGEEEKEHEQGDRRPAARNP